MNDTITSEPRHPKFVRWALLIGIVVILNVFFSVLVSIVFPNPKYEDFCKQEQVQPSYNTQESCVAAGGQWTENAPVKDLTQPKGWCNTTFTCQKDYEAVAQTHSRDVFISYVVLGVVVLIVGLMPLGSSIVSSGLSYGGVVALIIGSGQYWGTAGQWVRLAIALVGLLALIYFGIKRFKD